MGPGVIRYPLSTHLGLKARAPKIERTRRKIDQNGVLSRIIANSPPFDAIEVRFAPRVDVRVLFSPIWDSHPRDLFLARLIDSEPKVRSRDVTLPQKWGLHHCDEPISLVTNMCGLLGVGPCFGGDILGLRSHNFTPNKTHPTSHFPIDVGPRGPVFKAPSPHWHVGFHPMSKGGDKNSLLGSRGPKRGNFRNFWGVRASRKSPLSPASPPTPIGFGSQIGYPNPLISALSGGPRN